MDGGLRPSWGGLITSITVALLTRDKHDRLIENYETLEVTMEQTMNLRRKMNWRTEEAQALGS